METTMTNAITPAMFAAKLSASRGGVNGAARTRTAKARLSS